MALPDAVTADLRSGPLNEYWRARAAQHTGDSYCGVQLAKFPEDLRTYEHLLWEDAPDTVIELGTLGGGSAIWLRDRLEALRRYGRIQRPPHVITVDITQGYALEAFERLDPGFRDTITPLMGDVTDPATAEAVAEQVRPGARCLVIEDSAHVYDTTIAALHHYARFVPPGGYFVVEDGCVDVEELRLRPDWPRGVLPAVREWLESDAGSAFRVRDDLELYGVTCHPGGFLQRAGTPA
jgi:cephalosporin hydroxylase